MHTLQYPKKSGFTLVELSIVLVIIALIAGGVVGGKELIWHAQLSSIEKDVDEVRTGMNLFRMKYNCVPGDCRNATQFFGTDSICGNAALNDIPKDATCDGNGNGRVGNIDGANNASTVEAYEWYRFWQQLASAGYIRGSYSGTRGNGTGSVWSCDPINTVHCPTSKIGGRFNILYFAQQYDINFNGVGHYLYLGSVNPVSGHSYLPIMQAVDAQTLDSKFDDGIPATGMIKGPPQGYHWATDCTSSAVASTATYQASGTTVVCPIFFQLSDGAF